MINKKKVVAVLPAYNAERTLERTVEEIPASVDLTILVDDNLAGWKNSTALRDGLLARREGLEIKLIRSAPDGL